MRSHDVLEHPQPKAGLVPAPESASKQVRDLVLEQHGPSVLILHTADGDVAEHQLFRTIPVAAGDGLVLASARAIRSKAFRPALRQACWMALEAATPHQSSGRSRLFLALAGAGQGNGRGQALAQKISREFRADVFAPDGPLTFVPGSSIFAGTDDHSWVRFSPGKVRELRGTRYPRPEWENLLPRGVVRDGELHTRPIPAGLAVSASPMSAAFAISHVVAVSHVHPRFVLGSPEDEPIEPRQVAALLSRFPWRLRQRIQLVPADPRTAVAEWLGKLAALAGHDVISTTGLVRTWDRSEYVVVPSGPESSPWQPFSTLLRHTPDGQVLPVQASAPPRGWVASGPLQYRRSSAAGQQPGPHEVVAKVVPSGLCLLPASQAAKPGSADRLAFEVDHLTITLGWPCAPLPEDMPAALRDLLSGLRHEQLARVRIQVLGLADDQLRADLREVVDLVGAPIQFPVLLSADDDSARSAVSEGTTNAEQLEATGAESSSAGDEPSATR
ncbi:hypothetical protein [Saccharopolyspora sp. NPDC002686]|uniref:hypothetical protein n=1 Tax=Saccharopolyspora sp. NPDC002686 TaxID=3154541 RepID=UPI00332C1E99